MTTRLYPMPKIEFYNSNSIAKFLGLKIIFYNRYSLYKVFGYDFTEEYFLKPNQTFEQAVTEWVTAYVKEHFPGIEVPDLADETQIGVEELNTGYNLSINRLLEINPNAIREDV